MLVLVGDALYLPTMEVRSMVTGQIYLKALTQ